MIVNYYIPWLYNVIKSFKKTFNSKHRAKLKSESQRYRNMKNWNTERWQSSFTKRLGKKNADLRPNWTK